MISEICQLAVAWLSQAFGAIFLKVLRCLIFFRSFKRNFSSSFSAMISEIYHPEELAVARLSEAFGASPAKYIDFHQDNSSASMKTTMFVSMVLMAFMVALLWAWNLHRRILIRIFFLISGFFYIKKLTLMSLTEKKVELFSPPPPYILLSVWMMMELFNDYGTFTYKILQTKTKNSPKNKTKNLGTQFAKLSWCRETMYPTYQATLHKYWPSCRNKSWQIPKIWWPWQGCC